MKIPRIQIQIYPCTPIEPKYGAFYLNNKVRVHGSVLLVQLSYRVASPCNFRKQTTSFVWFKKINIWNVCHMIFSVCCYTYFLPRDLLLLRPSELQLRGLPHQLLPDVLCSACLPDHPHVHRDALKTLETHHQDVQVILPSDKREAANAILNTFIKLHYLFSQHSMVQYGSAY